jgi:diguanylate cyclase (GGDEF)-like protein
MSGSATTGVALAVAAAAMGFLLLGLVVARTWQQLRYVAEHDELTGLLSRPAILRHAAQALAKRHHDGGRMALLFIDLDGFQRFNDQFSHQVGDEVLRVVAETLAAAAEPGDVVGRVGGDEFVIVRPRVRRHTDEWAESVRQAVSDRMDVGGTPLRLTASIGLVIADGSVGDVARLLRDADLAVQDAKRAGADRTSVFATEMRSADGRRYERVAEVMHALECGQIETWYQPVINLETEAIAGAEALVRWRHPHRGVVSPDEFLPDIEAAGFMPMLTTMVLDHACEAFATGLPEEHDWMVTVNLSKSELSSNVVDHVLSALDNWGLPARRLRLEIDERTVPAPPIVQILERLVAAGVPIIVDDFGTGWSSFGQLLRISPSSVKLDRQLVGSVSATEHDKRVPRQGFDFPGSRRGDDWNASRERAEAVDLISAFSTLASRLDMAVVAEGIETPMQRDLVRRLGCTLGQGHLFAPAMPFETFTSWARSYMGAKAAAMLLPDLSQFTGAPPVGAHTRVS